MIRIRVHHVNHRIESIEITGHADSAPRGEDLVCAAVSSIATGALNAIDQLCPHEAKLSYQDHPEALIRIEVLKHSERLDGLLQFVLIQLKTVEVSQNQYIQIQEV